MLISNSLFIPFIILFVESEAPFDYSNSKKRLVNEVLNYKPRHGARSTDAEETVVRNDVSCFFVLTNCHCSGSRNFYFLSVSLLFLFDFYVRE